jgi:hypothetical protein
MVTPRKYMPHVALLIIGDGRDDLRKATVESFNRQAREFDLTHLVEVDDRLHALGFCGAIRYGWDRLREYRSEFDYIFHLEEDWRFTRPFSIAHMARVLDTEPSVAQVALRRGIEPGETAPVIDAFPSCFTNRHTGFLMGGARTQVWLQHQLFWTTNPSLYRAELIDSYHWPEAPMCEASFGQTLVADGATFAYWGDREDAPWIEHTGARTGHGY